MGQVVVAITVVGRRRDHIILSIKGIEHTDSLVVADDAIDHSLIFLDNVVLYGVVIEHLEIGRVDGDLYLIDKFLIVQVDGLHGAGIHLVLEEKMRFGDRLASQVVEKCPAPGLLAHQVDQEHAEGEHRRGDTRILQGKGGPDFHGLSVRIKPMPGLV